MHTHNRLSLDKEGRNILNCHLEFLIFDNRHTEIQHLGYLEPKLLDYCNVQYKNDDFHYHHYNYQTTPFRYILQAIQLLL